MARLRNRTSGVEVSVADEKADRFSAEWERTDGDKPKAKPATKRAK